MAGPTIPRHRPTLTSSPAARPAIGPRRRTRASTSKSMAAAGDIQIKEEAQGGEEAQGDEEVPELPPGFEAHVVATKKIIHRNEDEPEAFYVFDKVTVTFSYTEESDDEDEQVLRASEIRELAERLRRALRRNYKRWSK